MASSARLMHSTSTAANSDLAHKPPSYSLDPSSPSKSHGSMMEDLIRNMYESSESACGGGKNVEQIWKEISGGKLDAGGGDGSGFDADITLEEYLNKEEVRVPAGFGVDPEAMSQHQGHVAVENQSQVLGFGNGAESWGRGRGRKRLVLDPVDRAVPGSLAASDPRQPSTAKPYAPPQVSQQDLPFDYAGFLAVVFGITGVMFRYKLCSWLAIIFCAQSLVNMKNIENDLKQISMAMMFAVMGLVTNYFGPNRAPKTQA